MYVFDIKEYEAYVRSVQVCSTYHRLSSLYEYTVQVKKACGTYERLIYCGDPYFSLLTMLESRIVRA